MATVSSLGIGSGLDLNSLLTNLMAVERQPLAALQTQQSNYEADLSAYGQLKSQLSSFQTSMESLSSASKFQVFSATSSDDTIFTATADSTAAVGTYSLQVLRAAEAHQMGSNSTFADTGTTTVGSSGDTMTITVGSSAFTVSYGGQTLGQIRDAINNASDNTGVTATIIQDNVGYRLLLNANDTGSANALSLSYSGADPFSFQTLNTDRDGSGSFTSADLNASMILNGTYTIDRSSNTVDDVIQGVTLSLKDAGTATLTVAKDTTAIEASAKSFVDAYNGLRSTISTLRSGTLSGDNTLLLMQSGIQSILNTPPSGLTGSYNYLAQVGITIQKDGTMALDSTQFQDALSADFNGVAQLFSASDQGYAVRLDTLMTNYVQTGGLIDTSTDGINAMLDNVKTREDEMQLRLDAIQARYEQQFTALDTLVQQLQTTSSYLTQQISQLQNLNK
jgi:flagellar hook-associated protein 2